MALNQRVLVAAEGAFTLLDASRPPSPSNSPVVLHNVGGLGQDQDRQPGHEPGGEPLCGAVIAAPRLARERRLHTSILRCPPPPYIMSQCPLSPYFTDDHSALLLLDFLHFLIVLGRCSTRSIEIRVHRWQHALLWKKPIASSRPSLPTQGNTDVG